MEISIKIKINNQKNSAKLYKSKIPIVNLLINTILK